MPGIDDACPPPPAPAGPPRPSRPWHRGRAPAAQQDPAAALAGFVGSSLLSEVRAESEGKGAPSPSLSPSPAGPCTACRPPPGWEAHFSTRGLAARGLPGGCDGK